MCIFEQNKSRSVEWLRILIKDIEPVFNMSSCIFLKGYVDKVYPINQQTDY